MSEGTSSRLEMRFKMKAGRWGRGRIVKDCVATVETLSFTWGELGCHQRLF